MSEPTDTPDAADFPDVLFTTVLVEGGVLLVALAIGWYRGVSLWDYVRWEPAELLVGALATLPPVLLGWLMLRFPVGALKSLRALSYRLVGHLFADSPWWHLAFVSAWAGVAEELLFRGVVQQIATEQFGLVAGLVASSLVFGLAHPLSKLYFFFTALMGLYLGWIWILCDFNLLAPMIVHGAYDLVLLTLIVRGAKS